VFAAGDATTFPVKQGGLAAQQADAVAETIAASVGINIVPRPFRPVLRGMLLTGGRAWYMRADISGGASTDSMISSAPLWWPPNKLCGRYLAPFLSSRVGDAADVTPQHAHDAPLEQLEPETPHARIELVDFRAPPSSHRTGSRP
jgi:sulfide:quinone oxidoreductase